MQKKGLLEVSMIPILADVGPPWPFAKGKGKSSQGVRSVVPVGEGCTLYLSLPDDVNLPSTISMRLKAYSTVINSNYEFVRSEDIKYDWFESTDLTINFSGNQVFTIGKGSGGQATVKFQFTEQPFLDEPDLLGAEVSIFGYASDNGIEYSLNIPYVIVPS